MAKLATRVYCMTALKS